MSKTIPFVPKTLKSNIATQYNTMLSSDLIWVLSQCQRIADIPTMKETELLDVSNPKLVRQSTGKRNTPKSLCIGIIENFKSGQYDLTLKQMDGIVESFRIGSNIIEDFEEVEFVEVTELPKVKAPLVTKIEMPVELPSDLFDIDTVVVTYKPRV